MGERAQGFHPLDAAVVCSGSRACSAFCAGPRAQVECCVCVCVCLCAVLTVLVKGLQPGRPLLPAARPRGAALVANRTQSNSKRASRCVCAAGHRGATCTDPGVHSARAASPPRAGRPLRTRRMRTAISSGCLTADQDTRNRSWTAGGWGAAALWRRCLVVGGHSGRTMRFFMAANAVWAPGTAVRSLVGACDCLLRHALVGHHHSGPAAVDDSRRLCEGKMRLFICSGGLAGAAFRPHRRGACMQVCGCNG